MNKENLILWAVENDIDIYQFKLESGIIDYASLQEQKNMEDISKYLSIHKNAITHKTDGRWSTRLPVIEKGVILKKTFPIIKATYEALEKAIVEHYRQLDDNPTLYDLYYEFQKNNIEYNGRQKETFTRNMSDYSRFYSEFGNKQILGLKPEEIEQFLISQKRTLNLTQKAYSRMIGVTKCIFTYARAKHIIDYSINDIIENVSKINTGFRDWKRPDEELFFTEAETELLVNYFLQNPSVYNLGLLLCVLTGVRGNELSSLLRSECTKEDLYVHQGETTYKDLDTGRIICEVRNSPKTKKGIRKVEIPDYAEWIIPRIKQLSPESEWLFATKNHRSGDTVRARTEYFRKALYRACEAVNIPKRGLHCLRRVYGTILMDDGSISNKTIIDQMGHRDISMTFRHYGKNWKSGEKVRKEISGIGALKNLVCNN